MASQQAIAKIARERDAARGSAARARQNEREADAALKEQKKKDAAARKDLVKQFGATMFIAAASVGLGLAVGGQLARVTAKWGKWVQLGCIAVGFAAIGGARKFWHFVLGFTLLAIGGVKISDASRMRDWIPGDQEWENVIPDGKVKIVVVPDDSADG